ncbi:FAD:protein FMN transferase [Streptococcus sp. CSL10205-OR2]|uniref:FAD:protein FMN transferase n=1 Tax=Streptococcus sp. CSL10205-OR2 TaxID=2980558 RepID=UPI0021DA786F|nr:FAD:protein FMN transferase [Streptococcus sp. CSL10205-OR2]MCU9533651.1 FAD:protein FMN transferase [Streptococcus sp. CSL10205-OR2]
MKLKYWMLLLLSSLILVGCAQSNQKSSDDSTSHLPVVKTPEERKEPLLHTVVQLSIYHENQEEVLDEAINYIKEMEKLLSTNEEGSDVYRINHAKGEPTKVDDRTFELIKQALEMSKESDGKFDISIGAVTNLWQIGSENARVPSDDEIKQALPMINYHDIILNDTDKTVQIKEGMTLELGGISKGFIADRVKEFLTSKGVTTAIINLGGNVVVMGTSPNNAEGWKVGIQDPDQVRGVTVGSVYQEDSSIVTSGIYERYLEEDGKRYHHIIDPKTGYPIDNQISGVTVFTKTSTQGDGLSTSLFLLGIDKGLELVNQTEGVEAVFIDKDHGIHLSNGLKDSFELTHGDYHIAE